MISDNAEKQILTEIAAVRAAQSETARRIDKIEEVLTTMAQHTVVLSEFKRRIEKLESHVDKLRVGQWRLTTFIAAAGGCGAASAGIIEILRGLL